MPRTYPTSFPHASQLQFAGTIVIAAAVPNRRHLSTLRAQRIFFLPLAKAAALFHFPAMQSYELLHEVFEKKSAKEVAADLGLPLVVRPSYVLGGRAMAILRDEGAFDDYLLGVLLSPVLAK